MNPFDLYKFRDSIAQFEQIWKKKEGIMRMEPVVAMTLLPKDEYFGPLFDGSGLKLINVKREDPIILFLSDKLDAYNKLEGWVKSLNPLTQPINAFSGVSNFEIELIKVSEEQTSRYGVVRLFTGSEVIIEAKFEAKE